MYRIYRACSSWKSFHESLSEAKVILIKNQYPPSFIENIIYNTLNKIFKSDNVDVSTDNDETLNSSIDDSSNNSFELDPNACINVFADKDKFKLFINYRGKPTDQLA